MAVIRTDALAKTFFPGLGKKPVNALKSLTMEVEEHEIFGFLGPNGAGKTTTIKMLTGLIRPSSGSAYLFEQPAGNTAAHRRLGYTPEAPYFYTYLTGRELLDFMGRLCDLDSKTRRRRSDELLELVGMTHAADQQLRRYSKGMLQRIGIAQALIHDPELVILDEPMTGLDPLGRKDIRNLIVRLREEKKTVFFSTHILADVELVCDRVAILRKGELATLGPLEDLMARTHAYNEIALTGLGIDGIASLKKRFGDDKVTQVGDRLIVHAQEDNDVSDTIELAKSNNAHVLWVTPVRRSLEEVFEELVREGGAQGEAEGTR